MKIDPHKFDGPVLLAVSGGADSIVMASLFRKNALSRFAIAHCNFHLRGSESDGDAEFVLKWARDNGVKCYVKDFDTKAYAESHHISIEMAARNLRYGWFDRLCRTEGFCGVCVAHNANDNAETLLLNLVRGTGIKGLCAMAGKSKNPCGDSAVFRPMLRFTRAEIEEYAAKNSISFRTDSTNASSDYKRNLIRNEVFPLLARLNPSLISTLNSDICRFVQANDVLESLSVRPRVRDGHINIAEMKLSPNWRFGLYLVLSGYGFNSSTVDDVANLLESDGIIGGRQFFSPECRLVTTTSELVILPLVARRPEWKVERIQWEEGMSPKCPRGVTLLDAAAFGGKEPVLRPWREGDYLHPLGLKGRKKVSDILTDLKYNLFEKENVLVIEGSGSHVLAVVGERIDESVRITPLTSEVYRISRQ